MNEEGLDYESEAEDFLSNYEGEDDYEGLEFDFGGASKQSFFNEKQTNQFYKFKLSNKGASAVDRVIAISFAQFTAEAQMATAGITVDGLLKDGAVIPGALVAEQVTATPADPKSTINQFLAWCKLNPTRVVGMTIDSDDPNQFETLIEVSQWSPFRRLGSDFIIDVSEYYRVYQQSAKKIEMDLIPKDHVFQIDNNNIVLFMLKAGREVNITLKIGAINNQAGKLKKAAKSRHRVIRKLSSKRKTRQVRRS